jgi:hypothetical protein
MGPNSVERTTHAATLDEYDVKPHAWVSDDCIEQNPGMIPNLSARFAGIFHGLRVFAQSWF